MECFEKWIAEHAIGILIAILVSAVIAVGLVICYYPFQLNSLVSANKVEVAAWGQLGDFFGGTLNPIFGFLSVMALLAALVIQGRELRISSQELKNSALALDKQNKAIAHQSFEQTFFSWVKNYQDMLATVRHVIPTYGSGENSGREYVGRDALRELWRIGITIKEIPELIQGHEKDSRFSALFNEIGSIEGFDNPQNLEKINHYFSQRYIAQWTDLYLTNEFQLDSLFRNLYRLILWIDSQDKSQINQAQKWMYVSVARAQLSWIEMVYLFYNGQTDRGLKFRRLVDKYALFDNLNFDSDAVIKHLKEHPLENRGYADTAYDSRLARVALGLPESTEDTLAMAVV
jgi:Putative phage abortive infection protein